MIVLTLKLLISHVLGDFVFQPNRWVGEKKKKKHLSKYLYLHIAIHALALIVLLQFDFTYWVGILSILVSHTIIDILKLNLETNKNSRWLFFLDQIVHLLIIAIVINCYTPFQFNIGNLFTSKTLLLLLGIFNVTFVSAVIMRVVMSKWYLEENEPERSLEEAGKYIGILERLFVFGFIILNQWAAIGLLITAKSVFRFGDLSKAKDRKLTEYVLIGTLLSFGIAIGTGLLYIKIIKTL